MRMRIAHKIVANNNYYAAAKQTTFVERIMACIRAAPAIAVLIVWLLLCLSSRPSGANEPGESL